MLELHNSLLQDKSFTYSVPTGWFWESAEPINTFIAKGKFNKLLTLAPDAQVLYLAAHTMLKHGGRNVTLRWLYDLHQLICCYPERIDWYSILKRVKELTWGSALHAALSQTHVYFNSPIPEYVFATLSENADRYHSLVISKQVPSCTRIQEEYQNLTERKLSWRLISILGLVAPAPSYMRWRYDLKTSWSLPLWYLYRWWVIFIDARRTVSLLFQKVSRKVL
jgi:hypothetical protein